MKKHNIHDQKTILDNTENIYDEKIILEDIYNSETYIPNIIKENRVLKIGTVIDDYTVNSILSTYGAQSTVYLVTNNLNGDKFVLKLYNSGYIPTKKMINLFKQSTNKYVMKILDDGMYENQYYEITKYYVNGNLNDKKEYSIKFINEIVVPSINEGLKYLHGNNELKLSIIHGDLKPDNIFISDGEDYVIIGDFGISNLTNEDGIIIDTIKGTPEYSPLTTNFYKKIIRNPAYDYASFGLILYRLNYGYSLFKGLSEEEIAIKWNNGIDVPNSANTRLDYLIRGLLEKNEVTRFGYDKIKKWCDLEYIGSEHKRLFEQERKDNNLEGKFNYIFGIFNNKVLTVNSLESLALAMRNNWEHARNVIQRENFFEYLRNFDETIANKYKEMIKNNLIDIVIFKFINEFSYNESIIYKSINLGNIKSFFENFEDNYEVKIELLKNGLLNDVLDKNSASSELNENIKELLKINIDEQKMALFIADLFDNKSELVLFGKKIESIKDLIYLVEKCTEDELNTILRNEKLVSWLYKNGMGNDALKLI